MSEPVIHPLKDMVDAFAAHTTFDAEDRAALFGLPYSVRTFDAGSYLVREGDMSDQCRVILAGFVVRQKFSGEGLRQIVSTHTPGDVLGLHHLYIDTADHNIQTLTRCNIAAISTKALRELALRYPTVGAALFTYTLLEAARYRESMLNVGRRDARTRVAHLLCELAVRLDVPGLPPGQGYELPMTQEELGDAVGLTPVHVNRTLRSLVEDGLVVKDKRILKFPNWDRLVEVADFSSRYLHLGHADNAG
ncbi:Crp/Fnr family transcriptional regulator [Sphingomonas sp. PB2P12]|uniref:Crp/Fnr family transcriptional regulator n=1 Tax=Sphingomonas sandaracina TaxID=3096157 RepID=UPI002FC9694B